MANRPSITVYLPDELRAVIDAAAARVGQSSSAYMLQAAVDRLKAENMLPSPQPLPTAPPPRE